MIEILRPDQVRLNQPTPETLERQRLFREGQAERAETVRGRRAAKRQANTEREAAQKRLAEVDSGQITPIPGDEVLAELRDLAGGG